MIYLTLVRKRIDKEYLYIFIFYFEDVLESFKVLKP